MNPEPMVCRVCRHPLTSIQNPPDTTLTWVHVQETTHPADPIPRREMLDLALVCDFCSAHHTLSDGVVFEANSFAFDAEGPHPIPDNMGAGELGDRLAGQTSVTWQDDGLGWGACPRCAPLVREHRWEHLQARCVTAMERLHPDRPESFLQEMVGTAHETFRRTWTGREHPARLIEPPPPGT